MDPKSVKMPNVIRSRVLVVGESLVGKTAICRQLTTDGTNFAKNYLMTHFMETSVKSIAVPDTQDVVELFLLDCSGKELYLESLADIMKEADLIVAVYDVTKTETFGNVAKWVETVIRCVRAGQDNDNETKSNNNNASIPGVLVANKVDLEERRVVSPKIGSDLAQQLGLMYFECSAKTYQGVDNPFYYLANEWHSIHQEKADRMSELT